MKKISNVWTLVYKDKGCDPLSFSYKLEKDAQEAKQMVEDSDGGELINEKGEVDGYIELEWCYLLKGKLIEPIK